MRTRLVFLPLVSLAATLVFGAGIAHADGNAPAGNNGTIKIDGAPFDDGKDNEPHPGCTFSVEFFGYDAGARTARLEFEAQAPLAGGMLHKQTETFTIAERTGGSQFNHRALVDLTTQLAPLTPHAKQGYHVKLTVHVDGAKGADVKHKVFWVSECAAAGVFEADTAPATATPPATAPVTAPPAPAGVVGAKGRPSGALGAGATAPGTVRTGGVAAGGVVATSSPAGTLPRTGTTSGLLVAAALGLLAAGATLLGVDRRRHA